MKDNEPNLFNEGIKKLGNKLENVRLGGIDSLYEAASKHKDRTKKHT